MKTKILLSTLLTGAVLLTGCSTKEKTEPTNQIDNSKHQESPNTSNTSSNSGNTVMSKKSTETKVLDISKMRIITVEGKKAGVITITKNEIKKLNHKEIHNFFEEAIKSRKGQHPFLFITIEFEDNTGISAKGTPNIIDYGKLNSNKDVARNETTGYDYNFSKSLYLKLADNSTLSI